MATKWQNTENFFDLRHKTTEEAGYDVLTTHRGNTLDQALMTADSVARALSRLIGVLHERGLLHDDEVVNILYLHNYVKVED